MTILPKFLYLFQSIPAFIPKSFFDSLDSVISSYIWKGKHPRLNRVQLQKPKNAGGMALPNFRYYYWGANIFWSYYHGLADAPSWVKIELGSSNAVSVAALLGSPLPLPPKNRIDNPVVWHTLRVWAQFRKYFAFLDFSLSSPIFFNHLFPPARLDHVF